jgi:glycosyltransferase involved in cell wall biosynthesis
MSGAAVASVVIPAYRARDRIDLPLRSLAAQDVAERFEVIVVASGDDGCAPYVRERWPEVRLVASERRLLPGAARNAGVAVARGRWIAFLADDCAVDTDWLRRRLERHRQGFEAVGGAVANGTPRSPVGTAGWLIEYSAALPSVRRPTNHEVPHTLSYDRALLDRVGPFPEDIRTGEDTLLNQRALAARARVSTEPEVKILHLGPTRMRELLRHHHAHGRGLVQCVERHGFEAFTGPPGQQGPRAALRVWVRYPALRWWKALGRIARGRPGLLPAYLVLTPIIWAALLSTARGAWAELSAVRLARRMADQDG